MKFFKNTKYIRRCERLEVRMRQCWGIGGALAGDQMVWRLSLHCSSSLFNTCSSSFPLVYIYIYIYGRHFPWIFASFFTFLCRFWTFRVVFWTERRYPATRIPTFSRKKRQFHFSFLHYKWYELTLEVASICKKALPSSNFDVPSNHSWLEVSHFSSNVSLKFFKISRPWRVHLRLQKPRKCLLANGVFEC